MKRGEKKRNKKDKKELNNKKISNKNILIILIITLIALILLLIIFRNLSLTTKVIEKPYTPENCSNESIKKAWESIFKGSSENLIIIAPNQTLLDEIASSDLTKLEFGKEIFTLEGCPLYAIYQINGSHVKMITSMNGFLGVNLLAAISGDYPPEFIEYIQNLSGKPMDLNEISSSTGEGYSFLDRNLSISNIEDAKSHFESIFKISVTNWTSEYALTPIDLPNGTTTLETIIVYEFYESENIGNITIFGEELDTGGILIKVGGVDGNLSYEYYTYLESSIAKTLTILEKKFGNWTSPINTSLKNITIQVNNSKLDLLKDYKEKQKVKIFENNKILIETEINFTEDFDWTKIILKKQDINSTKGYVIINGLNSTKNVTVDRLNNNSESVCIKDKEIYEINQISKGCDLTNEYLLECPGKINNFTCRISGNKFIVTGLTHSAVIEILPISESCIPDWECDDWTDYDNNCGSRTCADLNNCENISSKPLEYQKCLICVPDWDCTKFAPEKCPKSERRTRTCDDLNDCGTSKGEPNLTQSCKIETNWMLIIAGIIGGIIILILIIILTKRKDNKGTQNTNQGEIYPRQPPSGGQTRYIPSTYSPPSDVRQGYNTNQKINPQKTNQNKAEDYYNP